MTAVTAPLKKFMQNICLNYMQVQETFSLLCTVDRYQFKATITLSDNNNTQQKWY